MPAALDRLSFLIHLRRTCLQSVRRDFPKAGAMIGSTAQAPDITAGKLQPPGRRAARKREGKEHAHLDACVTDIQSDAYRGDLSIRLHPFLQSRNRDVMQYFFWRLYCFA